MQNKKKLSWVCRELPALVIVICLCLSGCAGTGARENETSAASAVESFDISVEDAAQESAQSKMESSATAESSAAEASIAAETDSAAAEAETLAQEKEEKSTVLLFASDYQHKDGWNDPPVNFSGILDAVYHAGIRPDNVIFCGDYTSIPGQSNYDSDPHEKIEEIKQIILAHDGTLDTDAMIFEQGNHDEMTADISYSGLHEYEDYLVYVLNTENGFPWRQGKNGCGPLVRATAERLKFCLDELRDQGEERPIIIAGHIPLQFTGRSSSLQGTGDNLYSRYVFEVLNEAGKELNLVFLYGHNHSRGWDSYLGGSCVFRRPGDWLLVPDPAEGETVTSHFTKETLTFTYLNAGYVGYFSSAGGEDTLTCTICELQEDGMVFSRYSEDGLHILSAVGTPNPAVDDRKLLPEEYYGQLVDSGQKVYYHVAEEKQAA